MWQYFVVNLPLQVQERMINFDHMTDSMSVWNMLREFRIRKVHMAIVVNEYGGAVGVCSHHFLLIIKFSFNFLIDINFHNFHIKWSLNPDCIIVSRGILF